MELEETPMIQAPVDNNLSHPAPDIKDGIFEKAHELDSLNPSVTTAMPTPPQSPLLSVKDTPIIVDENISKRPLPSSKISSKPRYICALLSRQMSSIFDGYNSVIMGGIYPSMGNKNNFDWSDSESKFFLSAFTSIYFIGFLIGCLSYQLFSSLNPAYFQRLSKVLIVLGSLVFIFVPNEIALLVAFFLIGLSAAWSGTISATWLYELAVPEHRSRMMNSICLFGGGAVMFIFFVLIFDSGSYYYWRVLFAI